MHLPVYIYMCPRLRGSVSSCFIYLHRIRTFHTFVYVNTRISFPLSPSYPHNPSLSFLPPSTIPLPFPCSLLLSLFLLPPSPILLIPFPSLPLSHSLMLSHSDTSFHTMALEPLCAHSPRPQRAWHLQIEPLDPEECRSSLHLRMLRRTLAGRPLILFPVCFLTVHLVSSLSVVYRTIDCYILTVLLVVN